MKRILSILCLIVLVFLIVGIIDIFLFASWAFRRSVQTGLTLSGFSVPIANVPKPIPSPPHYESLVKNTLVAQHHINYKRLFIDIDPTQVLVDYDVYLRKDHPLFIAVEIDERERRAEKLANELLGAVSVSNELLKFEDVRTLIAETDESAHIAVVAVSHPAPGDSYKVKVHAKQLSLGLSIASNEVIVLTRGVSVRTNKPYLPVSKTQDHTIYSLPADAGELDFFVDVIDPAGRRSEPATRETLAALLQKEYSIPGFGELIYGLLDAIPFLLFIVWSSRNASTIPGVHSQQDVVKAYLVLHFSYYFFQSLSVLIENWHSPFAWALNHFEHRTLPLFNATGYNNTTFMLLVPMLAMFLYVWPKFARVYTEPKEERTSSWREKGKKISTVLIAVLIFVALLAFLARLLANKLDTIRTCLGCLTVAEFYLLFFGVLVLVLYVLIVLLGQFVGRPAKLRFSLTLFSIVMLLIVADFFSIYAEDSGNKYVFFANGVFSVLVFAVSAMAIVWAFAVLGYRAITGQSLHNRWKEWNAQKCLLLIIALLAVALSTLSWTWPMKYWPLWWLAWELKDLFILVLVWFLTSVSTQNL